MLVRPRQRPVEIGGLDVELVPCQRDRDPARIVQSGDALKKNSKFSGRFALTSVAVAALCLAAPLASAMGLGRLSVQSNLGEALRAEIEVTSLSPEEQSNLRIRVAPPESYRAANVDYNPVLPGTRATLERRDGRLFVRLISDRSVQEPFVDVILEISWATGRLVREYTLLFDPPPTVRTATPSSGPGTTTSPVIGATRPAPQALSPAPMPSSMPASPSSREAREAREASREATRQAAREAVRERRAAARAAAADTRRGDDVATSRPSAAAAGAGAGSDQYTVKSGDTLSRIAASTQRPGVSLDQMLVSLYRANPDAFMGNNMNRLKAGVVLAVPSAQSAQGVSQADARTTIQAQSADFGAYRQRLAGSTAEAAPQGSARQAGGRVQASVDDRKQSATPTPDKLTLDKGTAAAQAASAAGAEQARERERRAEATRVAELQRNLEDLKKMQSAASTPAAAAPSPAAPTTPATTTAAAPTPAPAVTPPGPTTALPLPTPAPMAASSVPAVPATPTVTAAGSAPIPGAAPTPTPPTPTSPTAAANRPAGEPGLLDEFLDNPMYWGIGGLLLLLILFGGYRLAQRAKKESGETSFLESRLQPDSFFGASGGQRIDTRDAAGSSSSMTYSLSQLDAIGDVDPVAEADVYLAYGRDLQAEEILKEAMRSSPERLAIRTKLLEVYAKRRDIKGFELLATQLFALTRGEGEDWAKAQELGTQIDPDNSLYQIGGAPERPLEKGGEVAEPLGASTLPYSVVPVPSQFGASLGGDTVTQGHAASELDLDLDNPDVGLPSRPAEFDDTASASEDVASTLKMPLVGNESQGRSSGPDHRDEPLNFDLSGINLDLDAPTQPSDDWSSGGSLDLTTVDIDGDGGDVLARKLELAEEFQRIGDKDGARDLLREVLATASGATKTKAQGMLDALN